MSFLGVNAMEAARRLFEENVRYNAELAKRKTKPRCYAASISGTRSPDKVIEQLKMRGVSISRRTLLYWERKGLIPQARRGSHGQGGGRWTSYPPETVNEGVVCRVLGCVYGFGHDRIAEARAAYYKGEPGPDALLYRELLLESFQTNGGGRDA